MALRLRGLPRISVRGRCVQVEKWAAWNILMLNRCYPVFWAALVGRHDLMPPFLPSAQIYSGRVRVSRPTGAEGMSIRNDLQRRGGVTPPYGEIQREKARQRERPGEGTRPYGSRPEKPCRPSHLSDLHPLPRTVMRGNRGRSHPQTALNRPGQLSGLNCVPRILAACPEGHRGRPEGQGESQEGV